MEYDIWKFVAPNADSILGGIFHESCILSNFFLNSPNPAYITNTDSVILAVNRIWDTYTNIPKEKALGRSLYDLFPASTAEYFDRQNKEVLSTGEVLRTEDVITLGEVTLYFQTIKFPISCHPGAPIAVAGISVDITKQKMAELAALKQRDIADKANIAKSDFLSNMSHEIRTPLNGILGMIALAQSRVTGEKEAQYLKMASSSAKILMDIVGDILDFSKIESGKTVLERRVFLLRDLISRTIQPLSGLAKDKNVMLYYDVARELPDTFLGDDTKIMQVINNIIGNAIKFTKEGLISVSVLPEHVGGGNQDCRKTPDGPARCAVRFAVRDSGIGIPADKLKTIFESFEQIQSDLTITQGGTGLGLAISKRFVEMMGGRIWAESELGKGSTFYFVIPFDLPPA